MTYPEFCEALVRIAALRDSSLPMLEKRLNELVDRILPLLQEPDTPLSQIANDSALVNYIQSMHVILRVAYTGAATHIPVRIVYLEFSSISPAACM
jgi:hypothetical protein